MALYTVPTTAIYRSASDGDTRQFAAGDRIDMDLAVKFGMPGAAPVFAPSADPLATTDLRDDFYGGGSGTTGSVGELGWIFAGGTLNVANAVANHPGVYRRDTGATISTTAYARLTANSLASHFFDATWIFALAQTDADTRVRFGLSSDWTTDAPTNGVYVEKILTDTQWFGVARAASVQSRTAALATVDTGWHKVRVRRIDAASVGFSLDDAAELTLAANVPSANNLFPGMHIFNNVAASKTVDLDFFRLRVGQLAR